jgi:PHD/YefM family antitoxin component YafN of YafNO toxin-antitoxin module
LCDYQYVATHVFCQEKEESILLTAESPPSYVVVSIENYEHLIDRLTRLEDLAIGQQAQTNLATSSMVGTKIFTAELQILAAL